MYALTTDGRITQCRATKVGQGRCNHIAHGNGSLKDFINQINKDKEYFQPDRRPMDSTPLTLEQKKQLSGHFKSCNHIKTEKFSELSSLIKKQEDTYHNKKDNKDREDKIESYEEDFRGIPCEMFLVDKEHRDGKELHVIKNNGIVEVYNMKKLLNNQNSRITKLIARPSQIERYYQWTNNKPPDYLLKIAKTNQNNKRNSW